MCCQVRSYGHGRTAVRLNDAGVQGYGRFLQRVHGRKKHLAPGESHGWLVVQPYHPSRSVAELSGRAQILTAPLVLCDRTARRDLQQSETCRAHLARASSAARRAGAAYRAPLGDLGVASEDLCAAGAAGAAALTHCTPSLALALALGRRTSCHLMHLKRQSWPCLPRRLLTGSASEVKQKRAEYLKSAGSAGRGRVADCLHTLRFCNFGLRNTLCVHWCISPGARVALVRKQKGAVERARVKSSEQGKGVKSPGQNGAATHKANTTGIGFRDHRPQPFLKRSPTPRLMRRDRRRDRPSLLCSVQCGGLCTAGTHSASRSPVDMYP